MYYQKSQVLIFLHRIVLESTLWTTELCGVTTLNPIKYWSNTPYEIIIRRIISSSSVFVTLRPKKNILVRLWNKLKMVCDDAVLACQRGCDDAVLLIPPKSWHLTFKYVFWPMIGFRSKKSNAAEFKVLVQIYKNSNRYYLNSCFFMIYYLYFVSIWSRY